MNGSHGGSGPELCGCCEPEPQAAPVSNRPGLPALAYRVGTHGTLLRRMLARLALETVGDGPEGDRRPLASLTSRTTEDFSISLLDAWALVGDVVTFYQERMANEGYLRTATERVSVLELARAIGYELNPGVAAGTYLAFTVEEAPGAPASAMVEKGLKVLSIPAQGQKPQAYETVEEIQVRLEWNAVRPRQTVPQPLAAGMTSLYLEGLATQLQVGDPLLLVGLERAVKNVGSERWDLRTVTSVTAIPERNQTRVTWDKPLGEPVGSPPARFRTLPAEADAHAYALRLRTSLFGYNAPDWRAMPLSTQVAFAYPGRDPDAVPRRDLPDQWPGFALVPGSHILDLDGDHPKVVAGSWLVLTRPGWTELYRVTSVAPTARSDFTMSSKVTRVGIDTTEHLGRFGLRGTSVLAQSDELELADMPIEEPVAGRTVELGEVVTAPAEGRPVAITGKRIRVRITANMGSVSFLASGDDQAVPLATGDSLQVVSPPDASGCWGLLDRDAREGFARLPSGSFVYERAPKEDADVSEVAFVQTVVQERDRTTLVLARALARAYDRTTVTVSMNVVRATHGETVQEVLGSGDGSVANQRFVLKKPPLTFVSAPSASGAEDTLTVRVDEVAWDEAPSLFGLGPRDRSYIVRIDDDARASVTFGDGESGARLPTGQENVTATYRSGIGPEGEAEAGAITLLQKRPLGVRGVTNPVGATGSAAPEKLEDARQNAPLTVVTLDRMVSLQDFEDFARAFAGIGKAMAVAEWDGQRRVVRLSVAGALGEKVDSSSQLYLDLVAAIDRFRDPVQDVIVTGYRRRTFGVQATVIVDRTYLPDRVLRDVQDALLEAFSFEARTFGQGVTSAEVVTAIQSVDGVTAVILEGLSLDPAVDPGATDPCAPPARPNSPHTEGDVLRVEPGDLLLLESTGISLVARIAP
ncbi:MAG: putative baseplate assembly protein [Actinomycetota bacterium]|nr:putative baseplate assembly protein [Actinomycetota bacterium]